MPLRAVFFDLDDTLCDTIGCRPQRMRSAISVLVNAYPAFDSDRFLARALAPLDRPRAVTGMRAALAELGLLDSPAAAEALRRFDSAYAPLRLFPGVKQVLQQLSARYVLGVVSNFHAGQRAKLAHLGLDRYFHEHEVTLSGETGFEKPDARIFHHALSKAGLAPAETVFVGDRLDIDIAGAGAAGLRTVWFNHWGGTPGDDAAMPDATITHFAALPDVLQGLQQSR